MNEICKYGDCLERAAINWSTLYHVQYIVNVEKKYALLSMTPQPRLLPHKTLSILNCDLRCHGLNLFIYRCIRGKPLAVELDWFCLSISFLIAAITTLSCFVDGALPNHNNLLKVPLRFRIMTAWFLCRLSNSYTAIWWVKVQTLFSNYIPSKLARY